MARNCSLPTDYLFLSDTDDSVDRLQVILRDHKTPEHKKMMMEIACWAGNAKIVKYLVQQQSLELPISYGGTLFHLMCKRGDVSALSWLKTRLDFQDPFFTRESIRIAAISNQVPVLTWLVDNYTSTPDHLTNAIVYACIGDASDCLRWILAHMDNKPGTLPIAEGMREACKCGSIKVVRFLLDEFPISYSDSCFVCACTHGQLEVAKMLLDQFPTLLETPPTKIIDYIKSMADNVMMTEWLLQKFTGVIV